MRRVLGQTFDRSDHRRVRVPDRRDDFIRRPTAAKRLIERHKTVAGKPDDLGALLLQGELLPFGVQHVEEVGETPVITLGRHPGRLTRGIEREVEAAHALAEGLIGRIRLVHLLDRGEDRFLVNGRQFMRAVVGDLDLGIQRPEVQDRGIESWAHRSYPGDRNTRARLRTGLRHRRQR